MRPGLRSLPGLLSEAQLVLRLSQTGLGDVLGGVSRRTIWRYQTGQSRPLATDLHGLAARVYPMDADLAKEIARAAGTTLEQLGIVASKAANAPEAASDRFAEPSHTSMLVDAIVCAAAETIDVPVRSVRAMLHAAFARAKETRLSIEAIEQALAAKAARRTDAKMSKGPGI